MFFAGDGACQYKTPGGDTNILFDLKVAGKLNMVSLIAVSKLRFKLEKKKKIADIGFNPKVLIGLSRFKKKLGLKSSMESTPRDEELDDDPNKMRFTTARYIIFNILHFSLFFNLPRETISVLEAWLQQGSFEAEDTKRIRIQANKNWGLSYPGLEAHKLWTGQL